jgi:hypothetical protein
MAEEDIRTGFVAVLHTPVVVLHKPEVVDRTDSRHKGSIAAALEPKHPWKHLVFRGLHKKEHRTVEGEHHTPVAEKESRKRAADTMRGVAAAVEVQQPTGPLPVEQEVDSRGHQTDYQYLPVVVAGRMDLWVQPSAEEHRRQEVSRPEEQQLEEQRPEEHQKGYRHHKQAAPGVVVRTRVVLVAAHRTAVVDHNWAAVRRVLRKKVAAEAVLRKQTSRRVAAMLRMVVRVYRTVAEHRIEGRRMAAVVVLRSHSLVAAVLRTWVPQAAGPSAKQTVQKDSPYFSFTQKENFNLITQKRLTVIGTQRVSLTRSADAFVVFKKKEVDCKSRVLA